MNKMDGGCLCGAIRYSTAAEPVFTAICHCAHCQKQTGSSFSIVVAVPTAALAIEGEPGIFEGTGDSGHRIRRQFCRDCGSPIVTTGEALPDMSFVKAGTLDDTGWLNPTFDIWCSSAQPWTFIPPERKTFEKGPA